LQPAALGGSARRNTCNTLPGGVAGEKCNAFKAVQYLQYLQHLYLTRT
jgi:hypothetical protein